MKIIVPHIFILIIALLLSACGPQASDSSQEETTASSKTDAKNAEAQSALPAALKDAIQPRTLGSRWDYASFFYIDGKRETGGTTTEDVIEVINIEGTPCYLIRLTMDYRGFAERLLGAKLTEDDYSYYWEYFNDDGSYNYSVDSATEKPKSLKDFELTLPYPAKKGYSYEISGGETWTVISVDETVKVPVGEFKCVVYQITYNEEEQGDHVSRDRYYMSPGVGLVQWESDVKEDGKWILDAVDDLTRYEIKPTDSQ